MERYSVSNFPFASKYIACQMQTITSIDGWHLPMADNEHVTPSRHSGAGRTKVRSALNAHRAARRVNEANNPEDEAIDGDSWIPACAGMTEVLP